MFVLRLTMIQTQSWRRFSLLYCSALGKQISMFAQFQVAGDKAPDHLQDPKDQGQNTTILLVAGFP